MANDQELEKNFLSLMQTRNTSKITQFLNENDAICRTITYDRTVQHEIATKSEKNEKILDVLIKNRSYKASDQTFEYVADQRLSDIFDELLNCLDFDKEELSVVDKYLILALNAGNVKTVRRLEEIKKIKKEMKSNNDSNNDSEHDQVDSSKLRKSRKRKKSKYGCCYKPTALDSNLKGEKARLLKWKVKTNPIHILVNKPQPLKTAIKYDKKLCALADSDRTNKDDYIELSTQCKQFAVDILDCCEDDDEVRLLIPDDAKTDNNVLREIVRGRFINFVTHPNCQHLLYGKWRGKMNVPWKRMSKPERYRHVVQQAIFSLYYSLRNAIIPPKNDSIIAMNNFIYFVVSYIFFLAMLLYSVFYGKVHNSFDGNSFVSPDYVVGVWVVTYAIQIIVDFFVVKHPSYRKRWWTCYQIALVTFFIMTGICNLIANVLFRSDIESTQALTWKMGAEGIYAIAITLSFMRIMEWLHLSSYFGPVIISFSHMTNVIFRLLVIFVIVLFSFSFGMYRLYKDFHRKTPPTGDEDEEQAYFTSYKSTLKVLFWVIFNYGEPDYVEIPASYYWNDNESPAIVSLKLRFTMVIGYIMWAVFHVAFAILLLNMLIAILTTAYESIQENSDAKWKLARAKLWMYYSEDYHVVPPPFNILMYIGKIIRKSPCSDNQNDNAHEMAGKKPTDEFENNLEILIDRYEKRKCNTETFQDPSHCERKSYVQMRQETLAKLNQKDDL